MSPEEVEVVTIALHQIMGDVLDAIDVVAASDPDMPKKLKMAAERFVRTGIFIDEYLENIQYRE